MIYVTPIIITVPTHTSITSTIEQTIAGTVFFKTVDASIPILPIKNDMTSIASINCTRSSIPTPPIVNTIDITGRLDTTNNSTMLTDESSFPITIFSGVSTVVSSISSVCFSRSPAILPAVNAGTKNITAIISMLISI